MTDNFADEPINIITAKAEKLGDCSIWSPRDALVDTLRRIDKGEIKPTRIVISYREGEPDEPYTSYTISGHDPTIAIGMLVRVQHMIMEATDKQ